MAAEGDGLAVARLGVVEPPPALRDRAELGVGVDPGLGVSRISALAPSRSASAGALQPLLQAVERRGVGRPGVGHDVGVNQFRAEDRVVRELGGQPLEDLDGPVEGLIRFLLLAEPLVQGTDAAVRPGGLALEPGVRRVLAGETVVEREDPPEQFGAVLGPPPLRPSVLASVFRLEGVFTTARRGPARPAGLRAGRRGAAEKVVVTGRG